MQSHQIGSSRFESKRAANPRPGYCVPTHSVYHWTTTARFGVERKGDIMNISRSFLLVGIVYLTIGVIIGMYMGGSGDHSLSPAHAHINLLGFTLSVLFAVTYRVFAGMASVRLAVWHFWLHSVGTTVMLIMLVLFYSGQIGENSMMPMPFAESLILLGVIAFLVNAWKNAH